MTAVSSRFFRRRWSDEMNQIDSIDERILAELQANGRLTMKALAERVGLSSPAMIERVRRLEDRGVIAGYRAIVAPNALGRPISALIAAEVNRPDFDGFLERLQNDPAIAECHRTTGEATRSRECGRHRRARRAR